MKTLVTTVVAVFVLSVLATGQAHAQGRIEKLKKLPPDLGRSTTPKVPKPTKLELISLECFIASDGFVRSDQIELRVYLPQFRGRDPLKFNATMNKTMNGDKAVILPRNIRGPRKVQVPHGVTVELWEIDKGPFAKDDLLGRFLISLRKEPVGPGSVRFTGHGSSYVLRYQLDP
jgi:hypothetical protein